MTRLLGSRRALAAIGLPCVALALLAGCNKSDENATSPPAGAPQMRAPQPSTSASAMSGNTAGGGAQALLVSSGCTRCHSINGQGGRMGPDLTHVGATKSADWIAAFVKDPNSKKPGSRMPAFKGRIPDSDIQTIAAYLASLK